MTDRVKALEDSVSKLDESEFRLFAKWFEAYQDRVWEKQFQRDAGSGKLDFLLDEARADQDHGALRDI